MHERETHAPRQLLGGLQLEGTFNSSAVAWGYGVSRHAIVVERWVISDASMVWSTNDQESDLQHATEKCDLENIAHCSIGDFDPEPS